jgi:hypothetical protein
MSDDATRRPGTVHRQKARRDHDCAECADPISKGQTYIYLNTFDRGKWSRYVLCLECERILNCHRVAELALGRELPFGAGTMRRELKEWFGGDVAYQREFRKAWRASAPVKEEEKSA